MDIKEFIELFITTNKLTGNLKSRKWKTENLIIFYLNDYEVLNIDGYEHYDNIEINLWISSEDKIFIDLLEKIYEKNNEIFAHCNKDLKKGQKYSQIKLNKIKSNLEWFNSLIN